MVDAMNYTEHASEATKETFDKKAKKKQEAEAKQKAEQDKSASKAKPKTQDNEAQTFYEEILAKEVEKDPNAVKELSKPIKEKPK